MNKKFNLEQLPPTHVEKGSKGLGIFLICFALFWGGIPTFALAKAIANGKFTPGLLFLLIFFAIGVALFIFGFNQFFSKTVTTIDSEKVSVKSKSLFGKKHWSEPLSNYEGIMSRSEYHSGGRDRTSYTLYIVELYHKDRDKRVDLYESRSDEGVRTIWEDCCRNLSLPAIEESSSGLIKRDVEDLDKSVRELAREGKVKMDFDPRQQPPAGITARVEGDVLALTVLKKRVSVPGALIGLIVLSIPIYFSFFEKKIPIIFGVMGIAFIAIIILGTLWELITKPQIRIANDRINVIRLTPWGKTKGSQVAISEIEMVKVGKEDGQQQREAVIISTDSGELTVGEGLSRDALEWLKSCITRVISG